MQPRDLDTLLSAVEAACSAEPARAACRQAVEGDARALWMPWIHRTGSNRPIVTWRAILASGGLTPSPVQLHEAADGRERSIYFFVGTCAYPKGQIVLVFAPDVPELVRRATFSPFDTGSLLRFSEPDPAHAVGHSYCPWTEESCCRFLQDHTGAAVSLSSFAPIFVAGHFRRATDYVTRPQVSTPDFPVYHALRSRSGDRRAWTIEVQAHGDDMVPLDAEHLRRIFVRGAGLFAALPAELKAFAQIVDEDEDQDNPADPLAEACARWICAQRKEQA